MRNFSARKIRKKSAKSTANSYWPFMHFCTYTELLMTVLATLFAFAEENLRWGQLRTPGFPDSLQAPLQCREGFDLRSMVCVEGLYFKRPIQCLESFKILTTHPPHRPTRVYPPCLWCGGRTHWLVGEGVGGQYFGGRQTLLCTLHM